MQIASFSALLQFDLVSFYFTFFIYLFATISFLLYLSKLKTFFAHAGFFLIIIAFILHTLIFIHRYFIYSYFPVTNLHQSLFFFAWCLVGIFIFLNIKFKIPILGSFVTPVAIIFLISSATIITPGPIPIPQKLQSLWLPIHTTLSFLGEAFFGVAFCTGVMYLIQENQIKKKNWGQFFYRLPPLQALDNLNYFSLRAGFFLLTTGIITGSIWAEYAWGSYWNWDPKETWALITWLIYAALLHGRLTMGWRGRRAAFFSLIGFGMVLFTFLGVNFLFSGLHSYQSFSSLAH